MGCLKKPVLYASLSALNHLHGGCVKNQDSSLHRFAEKKQYIFCMHNYLGKGVIPSCDLWKIRYKYKADNHVYVPFMESKEDEKHRLNTDNWTIFIE